MISSRPNLSDEYGSEAELTLLCPSCNSHFLHHQEVEVFNRKEDAGTGYHATVLSGSILEDEDISENPSSRRDAVTIHFTCEGCSAVVMMDIIQHKGATNIQMRHEEKEKCN